MNIPVPVGTTLLARPMSSASFAVTGRPVRTKSRARDKPIKAGSRTVPPSTSGTPEMIIPNFFCKHHAQRSYSFNP